MLGCSMRRFSIGLVSTLIVVNPPAVKHGGGVINQLSSIGHDSNWMKQDSLASGKCSKGDGKQEKMGEPSRADASVTFASSVEQLVQVSAMKSTRIHSSSSFSLNSGSWLDKLSISPMSMLFNLWNITKAGTRLWLAGLYIQGSRHSSHCTSRVAQT